MKGLKQLHSMILSCSNITRLTLEEVMPAQTDLQYASFCDQFLAALSPISQLNNLNYLNISRNHFGNNFLKQLTPILLTLSKLTYLDLSANQLTEDGLYDAKQFILNNFTLKELKFQYNKFVDPALTKIVAEEIGMMPMLQTLNLKLCKIQDKILKQLVLAFNWQLRTLNLSNNKIKFEGAKALSQHYETMPHNQLEDLDLSNNELNDFSAQALISIIKSCPNLQKYNLQENMIITNRYNLFRMKFTNKVNIEILL
eukprot:403370862